MKRVFKYIKNNKLVSFFWVYVVYGSFIYITNLSRISRYWSDKFFEEATILWNNFEFLYYYNVITNILLLLGLLFLGLLLRTRSRWFINIFLIHTLLLILTNYYNEYQIERSNDIPDSIILVLKNTVTGTTVLIWLIIWSIYFGKQNKPKLIFSNDKLI